MSPAWSMQALSSQQRGSCPPLLPLKVTFVLEESLPLKLRVVTPRVRQKGIHFPGGRLICLLEEATVLAVGHVRLDEG